MHGGKKVLGDAKLSDRRTERICDACPCYPATLACLFGRGCSP